MSAEGRIDHGTVGRINVERGDQSVTLRLWQHSLSPAAVLSFAEAKQLIQRIQTAMAPPKTRGATAPVVAEDDFSDLA